MSQPVRFVLPYPYMLMFVGEEDSNPGDYKLREVVYGMKFGDKYDMVNVVECLAEVQ